MGVRAVIARNSSRLAFKPIPTSSPSFQQHSYRMSTINNRPRVHVLGLGSIGTFAAHCLAEIPDRPSVTLMLHRSSLLASYIEHGKGIVLETREGEHVRRSDFTLEVCHGTRWHTIKPHEIPAKTDWKPENLGVETSEPIKNLIVSVKATQTVTALRPLLHRINASTTIMFLQNGAGMIEDVKQHLFQDKVTRPNFITGVISHGVSLNRSFDITHTGFAATSLGQVPRERPGPDSNDHDENPEQYSYLLDALPSVPRFNARSYDFPAVFQIQLEKLTVNAFCNPLCALADAQNKYLFTIPETRRKLITEISEVILALPELSGVEGVEERFSVDALEKTVDGIIQRTAETTCSMVWDLRAGRETEVRYINGYWVRRGKEVGVKTPINDGLVAKIEARTTKIREGTKHVSLEHQPK